MLGDQDIALASNILYDHWVRGETLAGLPDKARPTTRAEGYAIQARLESRSTGPVFGWKIAATSSAGQAHIGVDGPLAGRILAERVLKPGAAIALAGNQMLVAEAEFAFRMGRSLPPRKSPYEMKEVLDSVEALVLTIEIPDSRFDNYSSVGAANLIADNACAHLLVVGPEVKRQWRYLDLAAWLVVGRIKGKGERQGVGSNVLGDPRIALTWLANELREHGVVLAAGQLVTTGTCVAPVAIAPGDVFEADFGELGTVETRFV